MNKLGFRMSDGAEAYLQALRELTFRPITMSVLASRAIPAREALECACALPSLEAIFFGASSRANIRSNRQIVDELWTRRS